MPSKPAMRLALYALVVIGVFTLLQDRQIYYPDNPPRAELLTAADRQGLAPWPSADDYRGLLRTPAAGPVRGTLVLFHGNAGHAGHRSWYAAVLANLGLRVILAEYPAYGSRPGKLGETALVADAINTLERIRRQFPGPLLLAGESLGAGVAASAWARSPDGIAALLLITPWERIEQVAHHHYPWLPVGWLLRDRYDNAANLANLDIPVAVVVAERDSIVPAAFGRALFDGLAAPKRLWSVPQSDHNDWMERVDGVWWRTIIDFLLPG